MFSWRKIKNSIIKNGKSEMSRLKVVGQFTTSVSNDLSKVTFST